MRKMLSYFLIGFALVAATAAFVTVNPQQVLACDGDHRGS
jgi:hypothetical protein